MGDLIMGASRVKLVTDSVISMAPGMEDIAWVLWQARKPLTGGIIDITEQRGSFFEYTKKTQYSRPGMYLGEDEHCAKLVVAVPWSDTNRCRLTTSLSKISMLVGAFVLQAKDCLFVTPYDWKEAACLDPCMEGVSGAVERLYPEFYGATQCLQRDKIFLAVGVGRYFFSGKGRFGDEGALDEPG